MNNNPYQPYSYPPYATPTAAQNVPARTPNQNQSRGGFGVLIALLVLFALFAVTFIILFVWMYTQYADATTALNAKVDAAVATAVEENTAKLEEEFIEREKSPFKTFTGPVDYGELSFQYPKTWSVYEYASATDGGSFGVVFNPNKITSANSKTVNALRFVVDNSSFEKAISSYESQVKSGKLQLKIIQVNGSNANLYYGTFSNGFQGAVVLIKIRDKTAKLTTDSYSVFGNDFETILSSVKYNS